MDESLTQLQRHLSHLRSLRPQVTGSEALRCDLSLRNNVLFSLLCVCQAVIQLARDISVQKGQTAESNADAVRNLALVPALPPALVRELAELPKLRNMLIYRYLDLDLDRVIAALDHLQPVEEFEQAALRIASADS